MEKKIKMSNNKDVVMQRLFIFPPLVGEGEGEVWSSAPYLVDL